MEKEFWLNVWEDGQRLGFHQESYHALLLKYFDKFNTRLGDKILVPLCGKTWDLEWLENKGLDVHGVELSPIAVRAYFEERELEYNCRASKDHAIHSSRHIHLHCGDFFHLTAEQIGKIDAVWDRASLIALPTPTREFYYKHMKEILEPGAKWLLVTLDYPQHLMQGPPFSVHEEEVRTHCSKDFDIQHLDTMTFLPKGEKFEKAGVMEMGQKIFLLTRK